MKNKAMIQAKPFSTYSIIITYLSSLDDCGCISCGLCYELCPEVFRMDDDGVAEVYLETVPEDADEKAETAAETCPVSIITLE